MQADNADTANDANKVNNADLVNDIAPSFAMVAAADGNRELVRSLQQQLNIYLDKQRASMLGPDLSDRRNLVDKLVYSPAIKNAIEAEAEASGISVREARALAKGYANEMVNDYSHSIVRGFYKFLLGYGRNFMMASKYIILSVYASWQQITSWFTYLVTVAMSITCCCLMSSISAA